MSLPVHLYVQPRGQRVDHRGTDAVQAAGSGVRAAAELPARVQPGHDQLHAAELGLAFRVDRDAAAVVPDLGGAVRVQRDLDPGAMPAQRLVHGVVEDLCQAVLQPSAVGRSDVHAGALADRVQALEDRQVPGGVSVGRGGRRRPGRAGEGGHEGRSPSEARTGLIENSSVPDRMPLAMPRGQAGENPRLTMTNASTGGYLGTCPGRDTRCLCATGTAPEYR